MKYDTHKLPPQGGIILVDKAEGWTSHDIVAKSRHMLGIRKIGHAGTLDPMATGLLVLGFGASTRLLTHLVGLDKTYTATIRLGAATITDDREGDTVYTANPQVLHRVHPEAIAEQVAALTGNIQQTPSLVSAIKIGGRRAYDRVRSGEQFTLKQRPVTIHRFEIEHTRTVSDTTGEFIDVDVVVECSSGTYVRALARDLGESLHLGGHLTALRRTSVGPFSVDNSEQTRHLVEGTLRTWLQPATVAQHLFPVLHLTHQQAKELHNGKSINVDPATTPDAALTAALTPDGHLVSLIQITQGSTRIITNFPI